LPGSSDWTSLCASALQSATHLLPFSNFLHADLQVHSIILALITELPQTAETASILSELFPDPESLAPETRDKLHRILKEWQDSFLMDDCQPRKDENVAGTGNSADQRRTLSAVYYDKISDHKWQLDKIRQAFGASEEKLFISGSVVTEEDCLLIGSRPYERHTDFLLFLDTFYSISFGSCIESESTRLPLIDAFRSGVYRTQLELVPQKVIKKHKTKQSVGVRCTPQATSMVMKKSDDMENAVHFMTTPPPSIRAHFRSRTMSESDVKASRTCPANFQRVLSQPADVSVPTYKSGPGVITAATLFDSDTEMENTNNNNSSGLQLSPDCSREASIHLVASVSRSEHIRPACADCPSESVLPPATVERLKFDGQLAEVERVGEWLNGWAVRHHAEDNQRRSSAIRVRVSPQLLAYSLWLVDNDQRFTPHVDDVTVAMVHGQMRASVPREPSRTSAVVDSCVRRENMSLRSDVRSNTGSAHSLVAGPEAAPEDYARKSKKGRRKKPKSTCLDEVTEGGNGQLGLREAQVATYYQQPTEPTNRLAIYTDADRFEP